jgi:hypothetical protein
MKIHLMIVAVILADEDTGGQTDEQIRGRYKWFFGFVWPMF